MLESFIETGNYPEIYVDSVAEVQFLGNNSRVLYFTWQRIDGVFRRVVNVSIVRPTAGLMDGLRLIEKAKETPSAYVPGDAPAHMH